MSILSRKTYESTTLIFINLLCFHYFCAISREKPFVFKDFISILGHSFFRALRRIWQPPAARTALRAQTSGKTNVFFIIWLCCACAQFLLLYAVFPAPGCRKAARSRPPRRPAEPNWADLDRARPQATGLPKPTKRKCSSNKPKSFFLVQVARWADTNMDANSHARGGWVASRVWNPPISNLFPPTWELLFWTI